MENYIIASKTDVGVTRQVNEDNMITFDSPNGRVVAVCDGMGGQAAGDVASKLACDIIGDILTNNRFSSPFEAITKAITAANQGVLHRASQNPALEGMGATCVMIIIRDGKVYYGWVGDSRIYYISNHTIKQLSHDQSYVQSLVDSGQISPAEAANHPQKNEITNAIGVQGMTPPELGQAPITPEPGSVFLLCSDGLSGMVPDQQIERIVSRSGVSLAEKADLLVGAANQNGGLDNITVQLVQFGEPFVAAPRPNNAPAQPAAAASTNNVVKKEKKKQMLIYCVLAALILLAGGAWWYIANKDNKTPERRVQQTETTGSNGVDYDNRSKATETTKPAEQTAAPKADNNSGTSKKDGGKTPKNNNAKVVKHGAGNIKGEPEPTKKGNVLDGFIEDPKVKEGNGYNNSETQNGPFKKIKEPDEI